MSRPSRQVQPGRARLLWIGNLVLTVLFVVLAATADSQFSRVLALALAALTAVMALAWWRQDRTARHG